MNILSQLDSTLRKKGAEVLESEDDKIKYEYLNTTIIASKKDEKSCLVVLTIPLNEDKSRELRDAKVISPQTLLSTDLEEFVDITVGRLRVAVLREHVKNGKLYNYVEKCLRDLGFKQGVDAAEKWCPEDMKDNYVEGNWYHHRLIDDLSVYIFRTLDRVYLQSQGSYLEGTPVFRRVWPVGALSTPDHTNETIFDTLYREVLAFIRVCNHHTTCFTADEWRPVTHTIETVFNQHGERTDKRSEPVITDSLGNQARWELL